MPNWCNVNAYIKSTPEEIEKIAAALKETMSIDLSEGNKDSRRWLGNLLCYTGMSEDDVDKSGICCRGWVEDITRTHTDLIQMQFESAWSPQFGAFPPFFEYLGVHPEVTYTAEEVGMELYVTNDPAVVDTYILYDRAMCETYYDLTESDLHEMLIDEYDMDEREGESMPDLISRAEDERDISVYQYEYEDFDTWVV